MNENQVTIFTNEEFGNVRTIMINDKPYFCAKDVATALGYSNSRASVSRHCKGVMKRYVLTEGGNQEMTFIPEGDVYRLIIRSKLPSAEKFESWVMDEVLPQLRQTGSYSMTKQDSYMIEDPIERAKRWIEEQEEKKMLEDTIEEQKPLVSFANRVTESSDCLDIGEFAKVIKGEDIKMGRNKLFQWLRDNKYLMDNNVPYQKYIDNGLFKVIEIIKKLADDTVKIYTKTIVTGKGQIYLLKKLKEECD